MKRIFLITITLISTVLVSISCSSDDNDYYSVIGKDQLPANATSFINSNINNIEIRNIIKLIYQKENGTLYEVYFNNGIEVEFDANGNWIEVDGNNHQAIPTQFINDNILNYITNNYPGMYITGIEKKAYGFSVDISNDIDLIFNAEGVFVGIDH